MQNLYLKAMGIEVWRERASKNITSSHNKLIPHFVVGCELTALLNNQGDCLAYLLIASPPACLPPEALQLLDAILAAIQLRRSPEGVFDIGSLANQSPKPILLLGEKLAQSFLRTSHSISQLRGQSHYPSTYPAWAVFPSFGPEEILANPRLKRPVWDDLRLFQKALP